MANRKTEKLTLDERYVYPQAAHKKMRIAWNTRQTVYLYGSTGTGKTTFVANFLAGKRYHYFNFADIGPAEIAEMVSKKSDAEHETAHGKTVFVLDNLNLLETEEDRNTCGQLIEELSDRRDVWLILISRAPMPKWLKTVFFRYIFVTIGEEELCLTEKEQEYYF